MRSPGMPVNRFGANATKRRKFLPDKYKFLQTPTPIYSCLSPIFIRNRALFLVVSPPMNS